MIQQQRIKYLNNRSVRKGDYVLYWMQASQRTGNNHALEYAIEEADRLNLPVVVFFGLTDDYPEANLRHYRFMLEGLREVKDSLAGRGISFVIRAIDPARGAVEMARRASLVVADRGYLRFQRTWREYVAGRIAVPLIQVESDVVVPAEEASLKEEYSAATIRPRIRRRLEEYLVPLIERTPLRDSTRIDLETLEIDDIDTVLSRLDIDRSVEASKVYRGGERAAALQLERFLAEGIDRYDELRHDPSVEGLSNMSPYLHFGQISPLEIALKVRGRKAKGADAYLEELIVRRELAVNFVLYNPLYDETGGIPEWARRTLFEHEGDEREFTYSLEELEGARTHDAVWNAAQIEMVKTGKMHGYMRMYWGKKIIEWVPGVEDAFNAALYLNNRYELDGRDPSGFAGVSWCFGKHDRPWRRRMIFGSVRYMNDRGLKRRFDVDRYIRKTAATAG